MPRGKKGSGVIDWSDPAAVAAYNAAIKRRSPRHHEYNREYSKAHYVPTSRPPIDERNKARGEAHGQSKLTWPIVRWIREVKPRMSYAEIRQELNDRGIDVRSIGTLAAIARGETWKEDD